LTSKNKQRTAWKSNCEVSEVVGARPVGLATHMGKRSNVSSEVRER
jgi:hypothetical protein